MQLSHAAAGSRRIGAVCLLVLAAWVALQAGSAHADDDSLAKARAILGRHPLIDGHNDLP